MDNLALKALTKNNQSDLIGRAKEVEGILELLQKNKLATLSGPSGSGKSSLLQAGIIPRLVNGFMGQNGKTWTICQMRPGIDPISNLAYSLSRNDQNQNQKKANPLDYKTFKNELIENNPLGLINLYESSLREEGQNLLIIIDNVEDLFNLPKKNGPDSSDYELFFDTIARTAIEKEIPVYFLLSIQTQFISSLNQFPKIQELLSKSLTSIQSLTKSDLKLIAKSKGLNFTEEALNQAYEETYSGENYLPNFIFFTEHYSLEKRAEPDDSIEVSMNDLAEKGGIKNYIALACEDFYSKLPDPEKLLLEKIFKSSYNYESAAGKNAFISLGTVCKIVNSPEDEVLDIVNRLKEILQESIEFIPEKVSGIKKQGKEIIASTSVLVFKFNVCRNWSRESEWAKEELMAFENYKEYYETAKRYKKQQSSLLVSPELENALAWKNNPNHNEFWASKYTLNFTDTIHFIDESFKNQQKKDHLENERIRKKRKNRRIIFSIVSTLLVISVLLAVYAYDEQLEAKQAEEFAMQEKEKAEQSQQVAQRAEKQALEEMNRAQLAETRAAEEERKAKANYYKAEQSRIQAEISRLEALEQKSRSDSLSRVAIISEKIARESERRALNLKRVSDLKTEFYPLLLELQRNSKSNQENLNLEDNSPLLANIKEILLKYDQYKSLMNEFKTINQDTLIQIETEGLNMLLQEALDVLLAYDGSNKSEKFSMQIFSNPSQGAIRVLDVFKNKYLAAGGDGSSVLIFDIVDNFKKIEKPNLILGERIRDLTFLAENSLIASTFEGSIFEIDLENNIPKRTLFRTNSPINFLFESENGKLHALSERELISVDIEDPFSTISKTNISKPNAAFKLGNKILFASGNQVFQFEDGQLDNLALLNAASLKEEKITALFIQPFTKNGVLHYYLLAGTQTGQIFAFKSPDSLTYDYVGSFTIHSSEITKIFYDEDQEKTYSASLDNQVKKYNLNFDAINESVKTNISLNGHDKWVWDLKKATVNEVPLLITADENGSIKYWYINQEDLYTKIKSLLPKNTQ